MTATASAEAPGRTLAYRDEVLLNSSRAQLLHTYPHTPSDSIDKLLDFALKDGEGFAGQSGILDDKWKTHHAVIAYIRCSFTNYKTLLSSFKNKQTRAVSRRLAQDAVREMVERIADNWRNGPGGNVNALSSDISSEEYPGEGKISSTTNRKGFGALPYSPPPPEPVTQPPLNNKIRLPTLEEVQATARSKEPRLSSWHAKAVMKAHDPRSKVSKRKAPSYSGRNSGKLELAFARMDLTSIVQSNANDVDIDRTQIEAPPETQMANLVAETSALGLHDTVIAYEDDIQLPRVHSDQELSSDATISDPNANYQEPSKPRVRSSTKTQKRNKRRRLNFHSEAVRAAEMNLQALTQKLRPSAKRIAKASTRLETTRARLDKYLLQKQHKQEQVALKATMGHVQARAPEANAEYQYIIENGRIDRIH